MDIKRKKNITSWIGFFTGFVTGHVIHQHAMGLAFGALFAIALRELFD